MKKIYLTNKETETLYFFLRNINQDYLSKVFEGNFDREQVEKIYKVLDDIYNQIGEND